MTFQVTKQTNIILYGAGYRGREIYQYLHIKGYRIRMIIDRQPDNVKDDYACPVVSLESVEWRAVDDAVVIICLQNGILHDEIAKKLYGMGQEKILFLPTTQQYYFETEMRGCYQNMLDENWNEELEVPLYAQMLMIEGDTDIIRDDGRLVTAWIDVDFVFSSIPPNYDNKHGYFGSHISCIKPYLDLYRYFRGDGDYPEEYLNISYGEKKDMHESVLIDRAKLYRNYEYRMNRDAGYFSSSPARIIWDEEKHHFVVTDGHHRASYLYSKGWEWLPLRMTREDYDSYVRYKNGEGDRECLQ